MDTIPRSMSGLLLPIAYNRDSRAGPVRELEQVILEIHHGSFLPDATRSGYLRAAPSDLAEGVSDSEDSADEEDDAADQRAVEVVLETVAEPWREHGVDDGDDGARIFRHPSTRVIHAVASEEQDSVVAGR